MTTDRRRRWRLILLLVLVFCVGIAGGFYTYGVLSDNESVNVNIEGTTPTPTPTLSPGPPIAAALDDGVPTDAVRPPDERLIDDEFTRGWPGG